MPVHARHPLWTRLELVSAGTNPLLSIAPRVLAEPTNLGINHTFLPTGVPYSGAPFLLHQEQILMTPLRAALTWIEKGFSPVPVPHRSKRPVLDGWQHLEITVDTASQYFNSAPQNIGVRLGDKYGSTDADCDCPEAITAAQFIVRKNGAHEN